MAELVNMAQQFSGLPMQDLIGAPLRATCDAQLMLAGATINFINEVGFEKNADGQLGATRTVDFAFKKPVVGADGTPQQQDVSLDVPLLAIVNIPSLCVKTVDITFDMEVKSSFGETSGSAKEAGGEAGGGFCGISVKVHGSVSSHKENTRTSDNSAKYHVEVHARDDGMPEGLARVLDIMQSAIAPVDKGAPKAVTEKAAA